MKKNLHAFYQLPIILIVWGLSSNTSLYSQITNIGFENCDFTGWVGTKSKLDTVLVVDTSCAPGTGPGTPVPCIVLSPAYSDTIYPDPFRYEKMSIGAVNQRSDATPENSHFIMNSGYDSLIGGTDIPVVCPWSGTCSARIGNAQANGGGESMMYKFVVNSSDTSFNYNYAAILNDGGHGPGQQAYFKVRMYSYNSPTDSIIIDIATFDVEVNSAEGLGFVRGGGDSLILLKSWSSITIPLNSYIGKTVSIQFITRDCCPTCDSAGHKGKGGGHCGYAYIDVGGLPLSCAPIVALKASNQTVCSGNTASLSATGNGILSWYSAKGNYLGGGANYVTPVLTKTTTYYVQDSTCAISARRLAVIVTVQQVIAHTSATTLCSGISVTLKGSGALSYSWNNGVTNNVAFVPTLSNSYIVSGTHTNGCPNTTDTISVNIILPAVRSTASSTSICAGDSVTLKGWFSNSYIWSGGVIDRVAFVPSNTATYTVTVKDVNKCSNSDTITVKVNSLPNVIANASSKTICAGDSITLTGSGATSYSWTGVVTDGTPFVLYSTDTYTVIGTDGNSCSDSATITINVNPMPDISTTLSKNIITANQKGAKYQWLDCNNNFTTINGAINRSYTDQTNGNYAVEINAKGCKDTSVCIIPANCFAYYTTTYDTLLNTFFIKVDSTTEALANTYYWDFDDGSSSPDQYFAPHYYYVDTVFNICLKITNSVNDTCSYCHLIGKDYLGNIYRTSGFTINVINSNLQTGEIPHLLNANRFIVYPNPTNGLFTLQMSKVENVQVKIFNVIGECIYQNISISANQQIDLTSQPTGIYTLQLITEQGVINKKIVISH